MTPRALRAKRASGSQPDLSPLPAILPAGCSFLQEGKICVTAPDISRQRQARTLVAPTVTFHQRIVFITIYASKHFPANYGSGNIYNPHPQNTILSKKKRQFSFKHHFLKIALISKSCFNSRSFSVEPPKSLVHCP